MLRTENIMLTNKGDRTDSISINKITNEARYLIVSKIFNFSLNPC